MTKAPRLSAGRFFDPRFVTERILNDNRAETEKHYQRAIEHTVEPVENAAVTGQDFAHIFQSAFALYRAFEQIAHLRENGSGKSYKNKHRYGTYRRAGESEVNAVVSRENYLSVDAAEVVNQKICKYAAANAAYKPAYRADNRFIGGKLGRKP